jgi:uncharacterized protein (TIGR03437 family)
MRALLCSLTWLAAGMPALADITYTDGTFNDSDWQLVLFTSSAGGTYRSQQASAGGNPGSYRRIDISLNASTGAVVAQSGGQLHPTDYYPYPTPTPTPTPAASSNVWGAQFHIAAVYNPRTMGAISSIDYSEDAIYIGGATGEGQGTGPAVRQRDSSGVLRTYVATTVTNRPTTWSPNSLTGLLATNFSLLGGGTTFLDNSSHPDFSASGSALQFGYWRGNTTQGAGYSTAAGIDNWKVVVHGFQPGISCVISPRSRFQPFHRPEVHAARPDLFPNHKLTVEVASDGIPLVGVPVTMTASRKALSLSSTAAPSLTATSQTTDTNGLATFFHSVPPPVECDRTDFVATGTANGKPFTCTASVIAGIGALSGSLNQFFSSGGSGASPTLGASLAAVRKVLAGNRALLRYVPKRPRYTSLVRSIEHAAPVPWSESRLETTVDLIRRIEPHATAAEQKSLGTARTELEAAEQETRQNSARQQARKARVTDSPGALPAGFEAAYGRLPLEFEPNRGQAPVSARYVARGREFALSLASDQATLSFAQSAPLAIRFEGGNPAPRLVGLEESAARSHYLLGRDPAAWRIDVPHYAQVKYERVYPGVDVVFHGSLRGPEVDFVVAPRSRPDQIALTFPGADSLERDASGGVILHQGDHRIALEAPFVYQDENGERRRIEGRYVLKGRAQVGFEIAAFDGSRPLVIDPVITYASALGGSGDDSAMGIATDSQGNLYLTGATTSPDFPTSSPLQQKPGGPGKPGPHVNVFVSKLNAAGTQLVYSTYVGGSGLDSGLGIAVDSQGNAYVTGSTTSTDFPVIQPIQAAFAGGSTLFPADAFVFKLNSAGSQLVYSTYLGGNADDIAKAIAVDASGNAYIGGVTGSADFPVKNSLQPYRGADDGFIAKINPSGNALVYSTFLGGTGGDLVSAIAVDTNGNAAVTGNTVSRDFPLVNALQPFTVGGTDAFVAKLNAAGSALIYSTLLSGESDDFGLGIALDAAGNAYVTGTTGSVDFPVVKGLQTHSGNSDLLGSDAFITKLDATGTHFVYSTYLGGSGIDVGMAIAVAGDGSAWIAGETDSPDFPGTDPAAEDDAFIARLNPTGSTLSYVALVGGRDQDSAAALVLDSTGNAYVTGATRSADFPISCCSHQTGIRGANAFVLKIASGGSTAELATVSTATFLTGAVAPESIVSAFGQGLPVGTASGTPPLTTTLGSASVSVKDSAGNQRLAELFYVSPAQINYLIPAGTASGFATVNVVSGGQTVASGSVQIESVAPGLFAANQNGRGVPAGFWQRVSAAGDSSTQQLAQCGATAGSCSPVPIDLGAATDSVYLLLYGTGLRNIGSPADVSALVGGHSVPVQYAGPQVQYDGLDQVNLGPLPASLAGAGTVTVQLTVSGLNTNPLTISFK